jgi:hypothetical protein
MVLINSMKLLFNVYPSELEVNLLIYFKCINKNKEKAWIISSGILLLLFYLVCIFFNFKFTNSKIFYNKNLKIY